MFKAIRTATTAREQIAATRPNARLIARVSGGTLLRLSRAPDACAPGALDHSSAQLASAQLAKSAQLANTGEVTTAGAGALKLAVGRGVVAAVDGLPAIAATTIRTMIAEPRFPIFFLAISSSLSRQVVMRTAVE
jgi:hypothetical protein